MSEMLGGGRSGASDLDIGHHTPEFPGHLARRSLARRASAIAPLLFGPGDCSNAWGLRCYIALPAYNQHHER